MTAFVASNTPKTGYVTDKRWALRQPTWWRAWQGRLFVHGTHNALIDLLSLEPMPTGQAINRGLVAATLSSCVATAGTLWFPPLRLISAATLLYGCAPAIQDAYVAVVTERRITLAGLETLVLAGVLVQGALLPGALGFTFYYLARKIAHGVDEHKKRLVAWAPPPTARVCRAGIECDIAVAELQPGDRVIVCTGEMAPIGGIVVEGIAWVDRQPGTKQPEPVLMQAAAVIIPGNLVLVGRIEIEQL
jgi:cation transport ATPase